MARMVLTIGFAALALAGCNPPANQAANNAAQADANATGNAAAEDKQAIILGYNDRTRNVVFIRALMDAQLSCDVVTKSERMADMGGLPTWHVYCKNGQEHQISITRDGTAKILSRTDS